MLKRLTDRIRENFALTQVGAEGMLKAGVYSFLMYVAYMLPMLVFMDFVRQSLEGAPRKMYIYALGIGVTAVVMFFFINKAYHATYNETYKEAKNIRLRMAEAMKKLPLSYYSKHNLSDVSQAIMQDISDIERAMSHAIPECYGFAAYLFVIALLLLFSSPLMGLAILAPIALSALCIVATKALQKRETGKYYERLRKNAEIFQESIELQQEIKSYGLVEETEEKIVEALADSEKVHIRSEIAQAIPVTLSRTLVRLCLGSSTLMGIYLYSRGELSLFYLLAYIVAASRIMDAVDGLYMNLAELLYLDARIKRVKDIFDHEMAQGEDINPKNFDIELENVCFSYEEGIPVIRDLSLNIRQNEVTALIGPSGCGKTTLLRLISKLYDCDSGSIKIGGQDVGPVDAEKLFRYISIVFQDVILFDDTIMENIRFGRPDASDEEVRAAAKLANCDVFVEHLEQGYATLIGENGMKLSGGERQRISIARAILKDAPIILLDEISAALDVENEMIIQESLQRLIQGKTVVIISHRLQSVENADNIILLENGRLQSMGRHEELLQNSALYRLLTRRAGMASEFVY